MLLFNCLIFGHKNVPAHFQKIMQTVVDESDDVLVLYLDDVMIFGGQLDIVWKVVIQVIAKLTAAGFRTNIKKCDFLCKEVRMLGFMIGNGKVCPVARHLDVIAKCKVPRSVLDVQSLYGTLFYFHSYIPNFAQKAACISKLLWESAELK